MDAMVFSWTNEAAEKLRADWGKIPTRLIGQRLGCSKNAVIGKAMRLGFPKLGKRKATPERRCAVPNVGPAPRLAPVVEKARSVKPPQAAKAGSFSSGKTKTIPFMSLRYGVCKWPLGDSPFRFCGAKSKDSSYCAHHASLAYAGKLNASIAVGDDGMCGV